MSPASPLRNVYVLSQCSSGFFTTIESYAFSTSITHERTALTKFLAKCLDSKHWICSAAAATKIAQGLIQCTGKYFSREAKEKYAPVIDGLHSISNFVYGDDHPGLLIFRCSLRTPGHLAHRNQLNNSFMIEGFDHFRSDFITAG